MSNYTEEILLSDLEEINEIVDDYDEGLYEDDETLCPLCGEALVLRVSEYDRFFGCSTYPKCKGKRSY